MTRFIGAILLIAGGIIVSWFGWFMGAFGSYGHFKWGQASIGLVIGLSMIAQGMILLFKVILGPSDKEVNSRKRVS